MKKLLFVVVATILLSSCGTLFTGTRQSVVINSNADKAKIYNANGRKLGVTNKPFKVKKKLTAPILVLKHPEYKDENFTLENSFQPVCILNFFNAFCWGVDLLTGAAVKYDPMYEIEMEKK